MLSAPEAAGPSTTVVLQPLLRCAGIMLKMSNLLPKQLLRRCGRLAAVGCGRGRLLHAMVLRHHESSGPGLKDRSRCRSLISAPRGPPNETKSKYENTKLDLESTKPNETRKHAFT